MRILAALVLGYYLIVGRVGAELGARARSLPAFPLGLTDSARMELDRALGASLASAAQTGRSALFERQANRGGRIFFIPRGCAAVSHGYDLVVHFNGAAGTVTPIFERSGIDAVLAVLNLGLGSGAFEDAFQSALAFDALLGNVSDVVHEMCPKAGSLHRVALSSWSAGYGAVWRILDRAALADRVDAVLLADGLHAGFEPDKKWQRVVNAAQMAAFTLYADRAAAGEKLLAISHSSIQTPYASTTETSSFLLEQENVPRVPESIPGPRPSMTRTSHADRGNLHVRGFAGNDKDAHCDQLYAIGETLLPYLRERWSR